MSNQSAPVVISPVPNVSMPRSSGQSSTQLNCDDSSWVDKFQIPWSKCPETLHAAIQNNQPPSGQDLRQLISHTVSDVFSFTRRATRDNLRAIARMIVSRNPKTFADYVNGKIVGDGITSIMLMLESKKENLNRQQPANIKTHKTATSQAEKSHRASKSAMRYGCNRWEVPIPSGETVESLESKQKKMQDLHLVHKSSAPLEVQQLMKETYGCQRFAINAQLSITDLLQEWPYLGVTVTLLQHYKTLTDVDIESLLSSSVDAKMLLVYKYCCNSRANSVRKVLQEMQFAMGNSGESQVVRNGLLLLVAASLDEDILEMIIFKVIYIYFTQTNCE